MLPLDPIPEAVGRGVSEAVLSILRKAIVTGKLKPGQRLTERKLSEFFTVSTTPIKEALRTLELEGLVVRIARRGTHVSNFADVPLTEMYHMRAVLEGLAARFAAEKVADKEIVHMQHLINEAGQRLDDTDYADLSQINTNLHEAIRQASRNIYLQNLIDAVVSYDIIFRQFVLNSIPERKLGWLEHRSVVDAMARKDGDLAERLLRGHVIRSGSEAMVMRSRALGKNAGHREVAGSSDDGEQAPVGTGEGGVAGSN